MTMPLFPLPDGLVLVSHFSIPAVRTWGMSSRDKEYKETIRQIASVTPETGREYEWFVFAIRCNISASRTRLAKRIPDIENVPKLVVDAFTGLLYPDDNILFVRGIQVEGAISQDDINTTEVWIFGMPKDRNWTGNAG